MENKTAGVIIVIVLGSMGVAAMLTNTNGVVLAGVLSVITAISGSILGFEIGLKKGNK